MLFSRDCRILLLGGALLLAMAAPSVAATGEEVRFASEPGTVLAATLERPRGSGAEALPAALIAAGTGPWVRGGFEKLRARLLASGIAVLQYDKRGQGQSTGAFVDTLPAMEQDVAAAIGFLRTRRDIDPERIALIGMSQGAVAAPAVASRDPAVAAVVLLSGPVGPRGALFLDILRANLAAGGKRAEEIERVAAAIDAWMDARSRNGNAAEIAERRAAAVRAFGGIGLADGAVAVLDNPVVLSMYEAAPDRALAGIAAPVLAVYGSKDTIIAPGASVAAATAALEGNADALVVAVPGATHELAPAAPVAKKAAGTGGDQMVPGVASLVASWLAERLTRNAKGRID